MNIRITTIVLVAIIATGCGGTGFVTAPSEAPQPVYQQTSAPPIPHDPKTDADLQTCRSTYGNSTDRATQTALRNCERGVLYQSRQTVQDARYTARIDTDYRRQTQRELDAEVRRQERALRANTRALQDLARAVGRWKDIFD